MVITNGNVKNSALVGSHVTLLRERASRSFRISCEKTGFGVTKKLRSIHIVMMVVVMNNNGLFYFVD
jgi:hypothetical protein